MEVVSNQRDQAEAPASERSKNGGPPSPGSKVTRVVMLLLMVVVVAFVVIWGISSRRQANAQLSQETQDLAIPTVSVIHPKLGAPQQEIVIPGDMQPYAEAPIFARTSGYLKKWYADIGANVKAGQLLAEIDSPEVDQQLQQARADLATSQANMNLAEVTAARYKDLLKTDSVAQQDVDNATGNYDARRTTVESAQANV
jgi:multidrug efflux pump subunit AcrA (membrane-fusion protein)